MLFQLPRDCRVFCKLEPGNQWGWDQLLANKTNYLLEVLAWQQTKDGSKKSPRHKPKPFVPDFMQSPKEKSSINKEAEVHTVDEIQNILDLPRG